MGQGSTDRAACEAARVSILSIQQNTDNRNVSQNSFTQISLYPHPAAGVLCEEGQRVGLVHKAQVGARIGTPAAVYAGSVEICHLPVQHAASAACRRCYRRVRASHTPGSRHLFSWRHVLRMQTYCRVFMQHASAFSSYYYGGGRTREHT